MKKSSIQAKKLHNDTFYNIHFCPNMCFYRENKFSNIAKNVLTNKKKILLRILHHKNVSKSMQIQSTHFPSHHEDT